MRIAIFWRLLYQNSLAGGVFDASIALFDTKYIQNLSDYHRAVIQYWRYCKWSIFSRTFSRSFFGILDKNFSALSAICTLYFTRVVFSLYQDRALFLDQIQFVLEFHELF